MAERFMSLNSFATHERSTGDFDRDIGPLIYYYLLYYKVILQEPLPEFRYSAGHKWLPTLYNTSSTLWIHFEVDFGAGVNPESNIPSTFGAADKIQVKPQLFTLIFWSSRFHTMLAIAEHSLQILKQSNACIAQARAALEMVPTGAPARLSAESPSTRSAVRATRISHRSLLLTA